MYKCEECGEVFEEPKVYYERHPYGEGYAEEEWRVCPYCGEAGFVEAKECTRCGEYTAELHDGLCDVCYDDMNGV